MDQECGITYLYTDPCGACLVFNRPNGLDKTYVVWFDKVHGFPIFNGINGFDVFESEEDAIKFIQSSNEIVQTSKAKYLIGSCIIGNRCIILLITNCVIAGTILGKHNIYTVTDGTRLSFTLEEYNYYHSTDVVIDIFSNFKIMRRHFFCPTFDISSSIGLPLNSNMIWNRYLSMPYNNFIVPNFCVSLLQGAVSSYQFQTFSLFTVVRRRCTGTGIRSRTSGISSNGDIGNETEIEIIGQIETDKGYEIASHTMIRGTTPTNCNNLQLATVKKSIPVFCGRLFSQHRLESINFFDFSNKASEKTVYDTLKESLENISPFFDDRVKLVQIDWVYLMKSSATDAISTLFQESEPFINNYGLNLIFYRNDKIQLRKSMQTGMCLFTCSTGCDNSNVGTFFYSLKVVQKILQMFQLLEADRKILKAEDILIIPQAIVEFLSKSFYYSGNIISKIYCLTKSNQSEQIINFISSVNGVLKMRNTALNYKPSKDNKEKEKRFSKSLSYFLGVRQLLIDKTYNSSKGIMLLSYLPHITIISPNTLNPYIFSTTQTISSLNINDQPIIISLSRPSKITEIVIRSFPINSNNSQPSTLSIYGGMYLNRMFPIIEDIAIVRTYQNSLLRFPINEDLLYSHEIEPNIYENVRYLSFTFTAIKSQFFISNIFVYGIPSNKLITLNVSNNIKANVKNPKYNENVNDLSNVCKWELRRLSSFQTYTDFKIEMIRNGINPSLVSVNSVINLTKNQINDQNHTCTFCGKNKAVLKCGLCMKPFCQKCADRNGLYVVPQINNLLCKSCFRIRNELMTKRSDFRELKNAMIKYYYPFLGVGQIEDFGNIFAPNKILYRFLYELPIGKNSVRAEAMFNPSDDVWCPSETFVPVSIIFKQFTNVFSIEISCEKPLTIELNGRFYSFKPPKTIQTVNLSGSKLDFTICAESIQIKEINFSGKTSYPPSKIPPIETNNNLQLKEIFSTSKEYTSLICHEILLHNTTEVCGLILFSLEKGYSVIIELMSSGKQSKIWPMRLPHLQGTCHLLLPEACKCNKVRVWYQTNGDRSFQLPKSVQVLSCV